MIRSLFLVITICLCIKMQAMGKLLVPDTIYHSRSYNELTVKPINPSYLNVMTYSGWKDNWFVNLSGGTTAFLGSPLGCEDLFGRIKPAITLSLGKWVTPAIGARVSYQGFQFKNSIPEDREYQHIHADFLWNVASHSYNARDQPYLDIVPYVGLGIIHNKDAGNHPFAFSYGVMGRYRLSHRTHLTMELGGTTTFRDFDGYGASNKFGDNLMSLTAGLSFTIGKTGWKRVVDARPYIEQNEWLLDYASSLSDNNRLLTNRHKDDMQSIMELKKILEIEGLLELYKDKLMVTDNNYISQKKLFPKNDYSGLNSLRSRLLNHQWNGDPKEYPIDSIPIDTITDIESRKRNSSSANGLAHDYLSGISNGRSCIGAPIYFFFQLGTDHLTDTSQLINLDEIARVARKYGLSIRISGAADSATGTNEINHSLGFGRSNYISAQLIQRGIEESKITKENVGGINTYSPVEANRNTKVVLHSP